MQCEGVTRLTACCEPIGAVEHLDISAISNLEVIDRTQSRFNTKREVVN
jgi:hypothetical protein